MNSEAKKKFLSDYPAANGGDYERMVEEEARIERAEMEMHNTAKCIRISEEVAQDRIQRWADEADEYVIGRNGFTVSGFVASHRRACVWAVFIGREAKGEKLMGGAI